MQYRHLGRSGLKVSAIAMGSGAFGGSVTDVKEAQRHIDICLDAGVNLIDTANIYGAGKSETMIGDALTDGRRNKMLIATKVRFRAGKGPNENGLSRSHIIEQCEQSLKRLKTDVIDLYQAHEWDGSTPLEETMEAFDTLVRQGKVRYLGCSNFSGWHIMKALAIADRDGRQRFVSQQIHYSLQTRDAELELAPIAVDQGVGILIWSPLGAGLLSGKYRRGATPPEGARQYGRESEPPVYDWEKLYDIVEVLLAVAKEHNVSTARVVLAWSLQRPGVTSAIIGGRNAEQFTDSLAAIDLKLTPAQIEQLDNVSRPNLPYPYWHQNWSVNDRLNQADRALHDGHPQPVQYRR